MATQTSSLSYVMDISSCRVRPRENTDALKNAAGVRLKLLLKNLTVGVGGQGQFLMKNSNEIAINSKANTEARNTMTAAEGWPPAHPVPH